jgi:hypothetical protein
MTESTSHAIGRRVRALAGGSLLLVGIPLFLTPIPVGVFLVAAGGALLVSSSYGARRWIVRRKSLAPGLYRRIHRAVKRLRRRRSRSETTE